MKNWLCFVFAFRLTVFFLTRFFKLSSSLSALTERVTACAIGIAIFRKSFRKDFEFFLSGRVRMMRDKSNKLNILNLFELLLKSLDAFLLRIENSRN